MNTDEALAELPGDCDTDSDSDNRGVKIVGGDNKLPFRGGCVSSNTIVFL